MDTAALIAPFRRFMSITRTLLLIAAILAPGLPFVPAAARADDKAPAPPAAPAVVEYWYVMQINGSRAGWIHTTRTTAADRITSAQDMKLAIKRGAGEISITMQTEFVETTAGKPISLTSSRNLGGTAISQSYTYTDKDIKYSATQAGQTINESRSLPEGDWLTPAAAERDLKRRLDAGEKTITQRMMDASSADAPLKVTRTIIERTVTKAFGREVPSIRWRTTIEGLPITVEEEVDLNGVPVRTEVDLGAFKAVQLLADKALALSPLDAPEIMASTMIKIDPPLKSARTLKAATYLLTIPSGVMPSLPVYPGQQVERVSDLQLRVRIDTSSTAPSPQDAGKRDEYLRSSPMLQHTDPKIRELLKQADDPKLDTLARAERIRAFVNTYIKTKDFSIGFATASDVARTYTGDCTEHTALLCAMLRAAGIPSRAVSGVMYVETFLGQQQVFGYHMWSQALIFAADGSCRWVNLDAVLHDGMIYDATHIAMSIVALNDDQLQNYMMDLVPLLGKLKIKVEKTE